MSLYEWFIKHFLYGFIRIIICFVFSSFIKNNEGRVGVYVDSAPFSGLRSDTENDYS
uniref:Uncharacterized protein n=1 Tax=viral metagenome TaxID=1070528 RepID=A0A6C0K0C5_9ZZZZ